MEQAETLEAKWVELTNRAIFRLSGPDRIRYLNGQVTNDVAGNLSEEAIAACVCSLKGKVEFLVWISAHDDSLFIDGQLDQRDELFERLDRYLIADDCEISDVTDEWSLIHHFDKAQPGVISKRSGKKGFDCYVRANGEFPKGSSISVEEFDELQWRAKIPSFPWEITGDEFPAELGIAEWSVDFHKGCYLGQEVISRIESVGRVRRRLILVTADSELEQDSIVRTEAGMEARVIRSMNTINEKKYYGFCFEKISSKNTQLTGMQLVKYYAEAEAQV